jgi:hypothetical protein
MPNLNLLNSSIPQELAGELPPMAISLDQAIRVSGFSRSELYRRLRSGEIVGLKNGRTLLIDVQSLQQCVASLPRATFAPLTQSGAA